MLHITRFAMPIKKLKMPDMTQDLTGKETFVCLQLKMCTTVAKSSHPKQEQLQVAVFHNVIPDTYFGQWLHSAG